MSSLVQNPDFVEVIYVLCTMEITQSKFCQCVSSNIIKFCQMMKFLQKT
jgi:hypothetical protein